jgi:hypothetical protein
MMRVGAWVVAGLVAASGTGLRAQTPAASSLDWWGADSARAAFVTAHGHPLRYAHLVIWAPTDSLDPAWLAHFADSLNASVAELRALVGGPYPWQRIADRPVVFIFSPGRFISHSTGQDTVFISLNHVRQGLAPYLHETAHELLAPAAPFYPYEYGDSLDEERRAAVFPQWLNEGLPDYLAQAAAQRTGFHEGDVFAIGGLARVDSTCAARLIANPHRRAIAAKVGGQGRLEALGTTDRETVAATYYACSQSFTKFLADRSDVKALVALFPSVPAGTWLEDLRRVAGAPLDALRQMWLRHLGVRSELRWQDEPP